jgi:hypothetical protein
MRVASCSERSMPMAVPRCRPAGAHETHARDGFAHRELQPPDHTRPWWPLWRSYSSWPPFHAKLLIAPAREKPRTQSDDADDRSHTSEEAWKASLYRCKTDTE